MKKYKYYDKSIMEKVRKLRIERKLSIKKLEKIFNIPNNTISIWVRDIKMNNRQFKKAREIETANRSNTESFHNFTINKKLARLLCALLYWCEGSKYPASNHVAFANSDSGLIKIFLLLLRKGFDIDEKKFRAHLQIHTTHNKNEIYNFWSKLCGIPKSQFYRPTITKPTNSAKRRDYKGTCTIKYYNVKLLLQITSIFESFSKIC